MTLLSIALLSPSSWTAIGAPLSNHLWQSTVFAAAVWLLTLLLRKNHAQSRYVLWLVASAKFLIPFSLLIGLGSHIPWARTPAATQPTVFLAMETLGEPFAPINPTHVAPLPPPSALEVATRLLPTLLLVVWSVGCFVVFLVWYLRWRRLTAARRAALPLRSGRELEALRRMEQAAVHLQAIELLLSKSALEPGILGVFRPALLLPAGISEKLTDSQLESIIAHELCHVRRRDNLAAAFHMLVEALFWFHPLVWWMGVRLIEERERACDEEVLRLGADPHAYAEGILKVCKFYLESPLFCAAGVTGSHLKKRIEAIMSNRVAGKLHFGKKLLLSAAGLLPVIVPIAFGLAKPTKNLVESQVLGTASAAPMFESVTIRPNNSKSFETWIMWKGDRFMVTNFTLQKLIQWAYGVQSDRISGGPAWLNSQGYDVDAKVGESVVDELHELRPNQRFTEQNRMLQALLADRFRLAFHRETKEVSAYALTIAKNGPKLQEAKPGDTYPNGFKDDHGRPIGAGIGPCKLVGQGVSIADLVGDLSERLGRSVVDETGLKGKYDFTFDCFAPLRRPESEPSILSAVPDHAEALTKVHAVETASILEAVSEQLGLELNLQAVPLEILVIDHAEEIIGEESGQTQPQDPSRAESVAASMPPPLIYEAVSIEPDKSQATAKLTRNFPPYGFNAANVTLENLIEWAYNVEGFQIAGAPDWMNTERYDVQAKVDSSVADDLRDLSEQQRGAKQQPMLLGLLADHFKLEAHRETRELPVYELVVAGSSPKLRQARSGESPLIRCEKGLIAGQAEPIGPRNNDRPSLVQILSSYLQRPVLDKTGLDGMYDFSLEWTPGDSQDADQGGPSIFAAVQEQLGLQLLQSNQKTAPAQVLVIDHAEKPSEN